MFFVFCLFLFFLSLRRLNSVKGGWTQHSFVAFLLQLNSVPLITQPTSSPSSGEHILRAVGKEGEKAEPQEHTCTCVWTHNHSMHRCTCSGMHTHTTFHGKVRLGLFFHHDGIFQLASSDRKMQEVNGHFRMRGARLQVGFLLQKLRRPSRRPVGTRQSAVTPSCPFQHPQFQCRN